MADEVTRTEAEAIAELEVRRYFDVYLARVHPRMVAQERERTEMMLQAHDASQESHGGVERRLNRLLWIVTGFGAAGGTLGGLLGQLLGG